MSHKDIMGGQNPTKPPPCSTMDIVSVIHVSTYFWTYWVSAP